MLIDTVRKKMNASLIGVGFFTVLCFGQNAVADECLSYDHVADKLERSYSEQKLFNGFVFQEESKRIGAIYEFWMNPEHGSWSLVARKLVMYQVRGREITRDCGYVTSSGKGYKLVDEPESVTESMPLNNAGAVASGPEDQGVTNPHNASCIPHSRLAVALHDKYREKPLLQALTKDNSLIEIFASNKSWTITKAQLQGVKTVPGGTPLHDVKTGQEIRQICSTALFSGQTWGVFDLQKDHI